MYTKTPTPNRKDLKKLYYELKMTQVEIGAYYGVSQKIVWRWMRDSKIRQRVPAKRDQIGNKNSSWKGNDAGYSALHYRVYKERGKPNKCDVCNCSESNRRYQWASLSGNYADINDYKRMCESCHSKYDKKINNITK